MSAGTAPTVATVNGDVPVEALGVALPHEHPIHRISIHSGKADNTCLDIDLVARELAIYREVGGGTVFDVTPINVGRDTGALREVSRRSGVHIVSAVGLYQLEVWSDEMLAWSKSELADFLVREAAGEASGVVAGFFGEIASHNEMDHSDWRRYTLWDKETEIFQAVADAQRRTGLFISTHASFGRHGVAQLRTIIGAGGDPTRIVVGHCDAHVHDDPELDFDYYHRLLAGGAMLEFDLFGWGDVFYPDEHRISRIAGLVREGHADRLLLSTDTCRLSQLHENGGRGFDYLFTFVLPELKKAGVSEEEIRTMTVTNPARVVARVG